MTLRTEDRPGRPLDRTTVRYPRAGSPPKGLAVTGSTRSGEPRNAPDNPTVVQGGGTPWGAAARPSVGIGVITW